MDNKEAVEKWGFPLQELYRLTLNFYKQNSGKAIHLSYEDNLKLIAFKQQATFGPFEAKHATDLGVFDVIGKNRRLYWKLLGDISREQAMEGFIDLLDKMCSAFRPYIEAVKQNRDETLKADLRRMEEENKERKQRELEQQEMLEEGYKEEMQRRQMQDELNKQTYQQFKTYADKQFPGNPEQQAVLIHQLQQEHYHQYMLQLTMQNNNSNNRKYKNETDIGAGVILADEKKVEIVNGNEGDLTDSATATDYIDGADGQNQHQVDSDDDYVLITPAKMWTRPDIEDFKAQVSAGEGDGVITVGHGDTVTVRVPTHANGKCIFWEFASDNYDIGFGVYFEWSKPLTSEVTVHVSETDDDDEDCDEDYLSTTDDLEYGSLSNERNALTTNSTMKPPISIIVPIYRRECFNEVYVGSHAYPGEGVYLLKFDNTFSIWRSKTVYYRIYYEH